jgi:hypothetical protein
MHPNFFWKKSRDTLADPLPPFVMYGYHNVWRFTLFNNFFTALVSSINDVPVKGEWVQGFCDERTKAYQIKSVTGWRVSKVVKKMSDAIGGKFFWTSEKSRT